MDPPGQTVVELADIDMAGVRDGFITTTTGTRAPSQPVLEFLRLM